MRLYICNVMVKLLSHKHFIRPFHKTDFKCILKGSGEGLTAFKTTHLTRFNSQTWQRLPADGPWQKWSTTPK